MAVAETVTPANDAELSAEELEQTGFDPGGQIFALTINGRLHIWQPRPIQELRGTLAHHPELDDLDALRPRDEEDDLPWPQQ